MYDFFVVICKVIKKYYFLITLQMINVGNLCQLGYEITILDIFYDFGIKREMSKKLRT